MGAAVTADMINVFLPAAARLGRRFGEIARRCRAEHSPEHGDEGAGAFISQIKGDIRHGFTFGQPLKREADMQLLPPAAERHARFPLEEPRQCAVARADTRAPFLQVQSKGGILDQRLDQSFQSPVIRHGKAQRLHWRILEFVQKH